MNQLTFFEGKEMEYLTDVVIEGNKYEVLFNARNVGEALGFAESTLRDHMRKMNNKQVVKVKNSDVGETNFRKINNAGEMFLTESGIYKLAFRSNKEEAEKFTDWVTDDVMPTVRKTGRYEIQQANRPYLLETTKEEFAIAEIIATTTGVRKEIAFATAIDRTEKRTGESLEEYKRLLPSAEHDTGFMNATEVGEHIGLKAVSTNKKLESLELQYQEEYEHKDKMKKQWRLTEKGKLYGEEFPFTRNGHTGYQIRWNKAVLNIIKEQPANSKSL
ncbi:BRO family protein [Priestia megaterium]